MNKLYEILEKLLDEELKSLELGHGFDKKRIEAMFSIVTTLAYLQYAVITPKEALSILSLYNI